MSDQFADIESLLRRALSPVEPMRDPRNWMPTIAAVVVGSAAAGGLVLVRARQHHKKRQVGGLRALERSVRGVAGDIEKRLRR